MGLAAAVTVTFQLTRSLRSGAGPRRTNVVWSLTPAWTVCEPAPSVPPLTFKEEDVPAGWPSMAQVTVSVCVSGAGVVAVKLCDGAVGRESEWFVGADESTGETVL